MDYLKIAESISVIIASISAIIGINIWKKEFLWKKNAELAEELLDLFYRARDAISWMRSPFSFEGEGKTRVPHPKERPEDKGRLDSAFVPIERYQQNKDIFIRINTLRYRSIFRLGDGIEPAFKKLNSTLTRILNAAHRKADDILEHPYHDDSPEKRKIKRNEIDNILWENYSEPDNIILQIADIIKLVEDTCSPFIKEKSVSRFLKFLYTLISVLAFFGGGLG